MWMVFVFTLRIHQPRNKWYRSRVLPIIHAVHFQAIHVINHYTACREPHTRSPAPDGKLVSEQLIVNFAEYAPQAANRLQQK